MLVINGGQYHSAPKVVLVKFDLKTDPDEVGCNLSRCEIGVGLFGTVFRYVLVLTSCIAFLLFLCTTNVSRQLGFAISHDLKDTDLGTNF
jgi:hypothetical protein